MRTRFAPSPTGLLHVGGLRTALFAYLLAKKSGGTFMLRIEDTDQERSVEGAVENILRTLHWAGLDPDEGVVLRGGTVTQEGAKGPYIQSQRLELYRAGAQELLAKGSAYRCFCSPARLEEMRREQQARKEAPMYDRLCCSLCEDEIAQRISAGEPHVIRLKVPRSGKITFTDEIRGPLSFLGHTVDDQVLLKSDGFPTYHLAHVVDDHLMDIDLVIRGEEWLSSLPKHLLLFRALGWEPPRYAHVPLLLNKDKTKLSKRQGDTAAGEYIAKGYLPEAVVNFLALLGWNPGTSRAPHSGTGQRPAEQEIFSLSELIEAFSLERVQKAGAVFDTEKLDWLQGQWIRRLAPGDFAERVRLLVAAEYAAAARDRAFGEKAAQIQERITFFAEAPAMLRYFYEEPRVTPELLANKAQKITADMLPELLETLSDALAEIPETAWREERLRGTIEHLVAEKKWKRGQLLWPLRSALTGLPYSPGAFEVAAALGKETTLKRLATAKEVATERSGQSA